VRPSSRATRVRHRAARPTRPSGRGRRRARGASESMSSQRALGPAWRRTAARARAQPSHARSTRGYEGGRRGCPRRPERSAAVLPRHPAARTAERLTATVPHHTTLRHPYFPASIPETLTPPGGWAPPGSEGVYGSRPTTARSRVDPDPGLGASDPPHRGPQAPDPARCDPPPGPRSIVRPGRVPGYERASADGAPGPSCVERTPAAGWPAPPRAPAAPPPPRRGAPPRAAGPVPVQQFGRQHRPPRRGAPPDRSPRGVRRRPGPRAVVPANPAARPDPRRGRRAGPRARAVVRPRARGRGRRSRPGAAHGGRPRTRVARRCRFRECAASIPSRASGA